MKQLAAADESGATAYYSDREADVAKFLGKANRTPTADGEPHPFSQILPPTGFVSMKDAIRAIPAFIGNLNEEDKRKLSEADDFPVWTGEAWVGGMPFILNGFDVGRSTRINLQRLNNLERSAGVYFYSKEERTPKGNYIQWGFTDLEQLHVRRVELEFYGFDVKFDKTFYVWRLVSTNVPLDTFKKMYIPTQEE